MPTLTNTTKPLRFILANPARTELKICNLSDTTLYIAKDGREDNSADRAWPVKLNGVFELVEGVNCYKGAIYAIVSASSDIRVWET
jgi:hypothetical protein